MRHLKSYKLFEFNSSEDSIIKNIQDIFLPFKDEGMKVDVSKAYKMPMAAKVLSYVVGANKQPNILTKVRNLQNLPVSYYADAIHHLLSYMKDEGYNIFDFNLYLHEPTTRLRPEVRDMLGDSTVTSVDLYYNGKPSNKSVEVDPMSWLERFLTETDRDDASVREIFISFRKK